MSATLPPLPYSYDALEPYISTEIMTLHHTKHHQAYVNGLNEAEGKYIQAPSIKERIALQAAIKFNGGGHINHSLFWRNLAPSPQKGGNGGVLNDGPLKKAIEETFGTVELFKEQFNKATLGIQGSGWGWLAYNVKDKKLEITTTANQDPVLLPHIPIIGVDIWEHAFYLQYLNVKAKYLEAIWNVINFDEAQDRYKSAIGSGKL